MIKEQEILDDIIKIRKKTELLSNPLYNDFVGSHFWKEIDEQLEHIQNMLEKDKETYNW